MSGECLDSLEAEGTVVELDAYPGHFAHYIAHHCFYRDHLNQTSSYLVILHALIPTSCVISKQHFFVFEVISFDS